MDLEDKLKSWTAPSSPTEKEKQDRAERMICEAIANHGPFSGCSLSAYPKGSYANNTNVRTDSDVDIAIQCHEAIYFDAENPEALAASSPYSGIWTPGKLRSEVEVALEAKFPGQVDTSGSTAIQINSNTSRVDADVVPCFDYRYYVSGGSYMDGTKVFKKNGQSLENYPQLQLENGRSKNRQTNHRFKKAVRILKRTANAMAREDVHREVPSYLVECLVYNCPNWTITQSTWKETTRQVVAHIWSELQGSEPESEEKRWLEVNDFKFPFHSEQAWTRQDARDFSHAARNYLGLQ